MAKNVLFVCKIISFRYSYSKNSYKTKKDVEMKNMRITSKFQTTIPKNVRSALNIRVGDSIVFEVIDKQTVIIKKVDSEDATYAKALKNKLSEWETKIDDEAFDDLQNL